MVRRPRISSAAFRASAERDVDPCGMALRHSNGTTNGTFCLHRSVERHGGAVPFYGRRCTQGGVQKVCMEMVTTGGVIAKCMVRLWSACTGH